MSRCHRASLLIALLVAACGQQDDGAHEAPTARTAEDIALNNRGVALMGQFDYPSARDVFRQVVDRRPDWADAKVNLAIATLNRQTEGDEDNALALTAEVLAAEPAHLRAHYVSGLLTLYRGAVDQAAAHFSTVLQNDPDDAYAAYYLAQCVSHSDLERALILYGRAAASDPYLRSAYYGAAQAQRRLGRMDEAKENLALYTRLADNPRATLAEFKYTRMGPKGDALAVDGEAAPARAVEGPLFSAPSLIAKLDGDAGPMTVTTADLNGDGLLELFVTDSAAKGRATLLAGAEDELRRDAEHPLAQVAGVHAAAWGDVDNDGHLDVYLCRDGRNQLWLQDGDGNWTNVTRKSRTAGRGRCADAVLLDADHDGDLDILTAGANGAQLFNNNLDGTFKALAGSDGLAIDGPAARQILATDLDNDRDADLIVVREAPPHAVLVNDRLWQYRAAEGLDELVNADIDALVAADVDADGQIELYAALGAQLARFARAADGAWRQQSIASLAGSGRVQLAVAEFDGDGRPELVVRDGESLRVLAVNAEGAASIRFTEQGRFGGVLALVDDGRRGPSLVAAVQTPAGAELRRWPPGDGRAKFALLRFSGKDEQAESMRSNRSGIGTRVALRSGSRWSMSDTFDHNSGAGQSLQPLAFGLGAASRADYVALNWSDGVFQTELDVAADRLHLITETQRQLSSCPVVFAWNGETFAFVSDVLGVGGIGFLIEPGRYSTSRPWEYFLLPDGLLQPRDGTLQLKIAEPMEEIAYLDQVRLHAFDLAPGWSVVLDERMATAPPAVTGRPIFYRRSVAPARAFDAHGNDVLAALSATDGVAVPPGKIDPRFIGRTVRPHSLTVEFDARLAPDAAVLVIDGWVEYPYSQTVFAAWQAGAGYVPPTLEAAGVDGEWHIVYANFGYPAGMPRTMALPLTRLPAGTVALRLTSTLQLYYDRLIVAFEEDPRADVQRLEASLRVAEVAKTGFAKRINHAQRRPGYDYARRTPLWDSRYLAGHYTALGDALPLVMSHDDAFAIIGPGEEVHLEFAALPEKRAGWRRHYVFETRGFAKDMDLFTRDGGRVDPLPASGAQAENSVLRDSLHLRYNTRFEAGH